MANLKSKLQLSLRCNNLPRMDLMSKSDPFAVVYLKESAQPNFKKVFTTETIWNNENPEFPDYIVIDYRFEAVQNLRVEIYDRDSKSNDLSKHDYIGSFETTVSKIMGSRGTRVSGTLQNERKQRSKPGQISIKGKEVSEDVSVIKFQFKASSVDRKNWFGLGKSDPFYRISQKQPDGTYMVAFTSETIKSNLSPIWKPQEMSLNRLCNGDVQLPLKVEIFDWESNGSHQYIGEFETTVEQIQTTDKFEIKNIRRKAKKKGNSGVLTVMNAQIEKRYTFLQYIQGGLELNLSVAVDFTASNGHPLDLISLHHMKTHNIHEVQQLNEYQKAIVSVGQILEDYDTDKQIPAYGFGGELPGSNHTSHCFALNLNEDSPEVNRVDGLLDAYANALNQVRLSGPTLFGEILTKTIENVKDDLQKGCHNYHVLLILTDGIINDMDNTIKKIVEGASLPLSIIITGVGTADFTNMEVLDGDEERLQYNGKLAERDIVQFVPMREFENKDYTALAEATLEELPEQVVSYFGMNGIKPRPPRAESMKHMEKLNASKKIDVVPMAEVVGE